MRTAGVNTRGKAELELRVFTHFLPQKFTPLSIYRQRETLKKGFRLKTDSSEKCGFPIVRQHPKLCGTGTARHLLTDVIPREFSVADEHQTSIIWPNRERARRRMMKVCTMALTQVNVYFLADEPHSQIASEF